MKEGYQIKKKRQMLIQVENTQQRVQDDMKEPLRLGAEILY